LCTEEKEVETQEHRQRVATLKHNLVERIGAARNTHTAAYLLSLASQPIEATRHAAINLMRAIADQPTVWGLQMLFAMDTSHAKCNFFSYLQDHNTEPSKEGQELKFHLVQAIAHNPARCLLPNEMITRIYGMVKQGAYTESGSGHSPMMVEGH
jgi:hypothetical protein